MKRLFIKPFSARINAEVCRELKEIKQDFTQGQADESVIWQYMGHKSLRAIVCLVLTSISQIAEETFHERSMETRTTVTKSITKSIDSRKEVSKSQDRSQKCSSKQKRRRPSSSGKLDMVDHLNTMTPHEVFQLVH